MTGKCSLYAYCGFSLLPSVYKNSETDDYLITRDRLMDYECYGRRIVDEVTARINGMDLDDIENIY